MSTIQREQNLIVRDKDTKIMVVQGVAGSGKTSIALHRIAYLLYKNRKNINSSNIIIISPNAVFSDYISNILPELGEENICEMKFDELAHKELKGLGTLEGKYTQTEYIIMVNKPDDIRIQRINLKNTSVYTKEIISYIDVLERKIISYKDLVFHDIIYEKEVIQSLYENRFHTKPIFERLKMISDYIADRYETDFNVSVSKKSRQQIYDSLLEMFNFTDVVALYQNFVDYLSNRYDILNGDKIDTCEILYEDIYPIVLIKILLFGTQGFQNIKHVIIDEMQDYNATQYEILNRIFDCNMTILGDIQQVIYKTNDDVIEKLKDYLVRSMYQGIT